MEKQPSFAELKRKNSKRFGTKSAHKIDKEKRKAAMGKYNARKKQEEEILDARVMHNNEMSTLKTRAQQLEFDLQNPIAEPPLTDEDRRAKEKELASVVLDMQSKKDAFQQHIQYLQSQLPPYTAEEALFVRGEEALLSINELKVGSRTAEQKRKETRDSMKTLVSTFDEFFQVTNGKPFEALRNAEVQLLTWIRDQTDFNHTRAIETFDLETLLRRGLFGDVGISSDQVDRILFLTAGVESIETLRGFYIVGSKIYEVAKAEKALMEQVKGMDRNSEEAKLRSERIRESAQQRLEFESNFAQRMNEAIRKAHKNPTDARAQNEVVKIERERTIVRKEWARTATVEMMFEQEIQRRKVMVHSPHRRSPVASPRGSPSPQSRTVSPKTQERPTTAPQKPAATSSTSSRPQSSGPSIYQVFLRKNRQCELRLSSDLSHGSLRLQSSLKEAFQRAPLTGTLEGLQPETVEQLRILFQHIGAGGGAPSDGGITTAQLANFMAEWSPWGCDAAEAREFLAAECGSTNPDVLTFDDFIRFGPLLRARVHRPVEFGKLPEQEKDEVVESRLQHGLSLTRYESAYVRGKQSLASRSEETASKREKVLPTSSFRSAPHPQCIPDGKEDELATSFKLKEKRRMRLQSAGSDRHHGRGEKGGELSRSPQPPTEDVDWGNSSLPPSGGREGEKSPVPHTPKSARNVSSGVSPRAQRHHPGNPNPVKLNLRLLFPELQRMTQSPPLEVQRKLKRAQEDFELSQALAQRYEVVVQS
jgi:hypothetical protein